MADERKTFGTLYLEAPITRADFERALRSLHLSGLDTRDLVMRLAAQVVALTEELQRRSDATAHSAMPPLAPASSPANESIAARVHAELPAVLARIHASDARSRGQVWMDTSLENKYEVEGSSPPCDELLHLCGARCCQLEFPLSTADLDEGVIRWDYGQPYMIRQRASDGFCVHNDPTTHGCTVHTQRPATCRRYDCRGDARVWIDYANRIPAPPGTFGDGLASLEPFDLVDRAKRRAAAEAIALNALTHAYPDDEPRPGPPPTPHVPRPKS